MSDLLEIVLEIVLEGALHGASSRRVPLVVRALLAAVLAALWLGLSGLLLYVGMQSGSIPLMFCGGLFWPAAESCWRIKSAGSAAVNKTGSISRRKSRFLL